MLVCGTRTDGRRSLVQDQQLASPHNRPSERKNLTLPHGQVRAASGDFGIERDACLVAFFLEVEEAG